MFMNLWFGSSCFWSCSWSWVWYFGLVFWLAPAFTIADVWIFGLEFESGL